MPTAIGKDRAAAAREAFHSYLKNRGIKLTTPRKSILEAVLGFGSHFEAEQLLFALQQRDRRVAKATIYRTLPLLVDCGILKQVQFNVKQAHFKLCFGEAPQDLLVCRRCGRIVEFDSQDVVELRSRLAEDHGYQATSHRFQVWGLCWECAREDNSETGRSLESPGP